jgi:hypothetical protein
MAKDRKRGPDQRAGHSEDRQCGKAAAKAFPPAPPSQWRLVSFWHHQEYGPLLHSSARPRGRRGRTLAVAELRTQFSDS